MAGEAPEYVAWIRHRQCCAPGAPRGCVGIVQAHHAGKNPGMRLKAHDETCIPLCAQHHCDIDSMSGPFRAMTGPELRDWQDQQIRQHRQAYRGDIDYDAMAF
jgi:hypothetical protein